VTTYRTIAAGGGTSGTGNRTAAITGAVGDLLVVFASLSANTGASVTVTDNQGGVYEQIGSAALWGTSANSLVAFVRATLVSSAVSHTVTVNSGSNTAGQISIVACSSSNRAGISAIRSYGSQSNGAASSTPAPVLSQAALTG